MAGKQARGELATWVFHQCFCIIILLFVAASFLSCVRGFGGEGAFIFIGREQPVLSFPFLSSTGPPSSLAVMQ